MDEFSELAALHYADKFCLTCNEWSPCSCMYERAVERIRELEAARSILIRFAEIWLGTGSDDEQLCMAHDFFDGVLHPPALGVLSPEEG